MKRITRIIILLALAAICSCFILGCKKEESESPDKKELENILANPQNYPQLTTEEFLQFIDGKTDLTADDLPMDKACYKADRFNLTRYIIDGKFLFSCYIHESVAARSMYTLDYFENGKIVETVSSIPNFADFIAKHGE
ncbi:MAG: hypothetical protein J1E60_07510 [Christensenellaceae bacterium]|nr:hypothetical protein [Christensenellaceae bacterium]